jgi:hypothetical protein
MFSVLRNKVLLDKHPTLQGSKPGEKPAKGVVLGEAP